MRRREGAAARTAKSGHGRSRSEEEIALDRLKDQKLGCEGAPAEILPDA
jgi:hypothetical protein